METPKWTKAQQQVIDLRNKNILVSAAAGSGKTAVLVERIIAKITEGENPPDIDRLVVVTFTRAAAAQMRTRIEEGLEKKLALDPENKHIGRQISLVHAAHICTIDSFCQWMVKNYFSAIDLDPDFRVADEKELTVLQGDVLRDLLEEKYRGAQENKEDGFLALAGTLGYGRKDDEIEKMVLKLYRASSSNPWREEWLKSVGALYEVRTTQELETSPWMHELIDYVSSCVRGYREWEEKLLAVCQQEDGPGAYADAIVSDIAMLNKWECLSGYGEYRQAFENLKFKTRKSIAAKDKAKVNPKKDELVKTQRDKVKKGLANLRETFFFQDIEQNLADMAQMAPVVRELSNLTLDFHRKFFAAKRERGIVDFTDLENFALEILVKKENGSKHQSKTDTPPLVASQVALELQDYFDEIFIDEYQDSNLTQELLLSALCRGPKAKPYMFMVGDVKQSIYRFRKAEPEIFMEKYRRYRAEDCPEQKVILRENFRSRKEVLNFCNHIFFSVMREELGGIAYDENARLVAGANYPETDGRTAGKPEVILIEEKSEDNPVPKRQLEAAAIGEKIAAMVNAKNPMTVFNGQTYRPARYGDIAILLRSLDGVEDYLDVLSDLGIPAYAEKKEGYFSAAEVEIVLNTLRVIDNPRQDIPLVSVMRAFLFSFTDEELAAVGAQKAGPNFYDKVLAVVDADREKTDELTEKLTGFLTWMSDLRAWEKFHTVYELLRRIYFDTDYYAMVSAMPGGEKRSANLDLLLQHALNFADGGNTGIYAFARYIENLQKAQVDFGEANVNGENTDAVRIMTIHGSKGLEFPVVFLAGMGRELHKETSADRVIVDKDYGIGCEWVDPRRHIKSQMLAKRFLINRENLNNRAEEVRVLYVALTRAKEKLLLTGTVKDLAKAVENWQLQSGELNFLQLSSAKTYLDWVMPVLLDGELKTQTGGWSDSASRAPFAGEDEFCALTLTFPERLFFADAREQRADSAKRESLLAIDPGTVYDADMRQALAEQEAYVYPYAADATLPAKLSVSEIKRRAQKRAEETAEADGEEWERVEEVTLFGAGDFVKKADGEREKPGASGDVSGAGAPEESAHSEISGATYGTLCHLVMEHLPLANFDGENVRDAVQEFLEKMQSAGYITAAEKESLHAEKFAEFLNSNLGVRMRQAETAGTLRREQQFMLGLPANQLIPESTSTELIPVQGIIDAYFVQGDHIVLVDYKTDAVCPGQESVLADRYRVQLDLYAQALETILKKPVTEKFIYSFALGVEILLGSKSF